MSVDVKLRLVTTEPEHAPRKAWHPRFPLALPSPQIIADARHVVAHPETYADRPFLRRLAWITLLNARGLAADQTRLCQMQVKAI